MYGEKKLFRVLFNHTAPKDQKVGIEEYVIANSELQVYSYIDNEYIYNKWKDNEDKTFDVYDEEWNIIGYEKFKEKIIRIKGEMNDEDYDYSDTYYGITLYGWEFVKDLTDIEFEALTNIGIVKCL